MGVLLYKPDTRGFYPSKSGYKIGRTPHIKVFAGRDPTAPQVRRHTSKATTWKKHI